MVWTLFLLLPHEECLFLSILGFETIPQPVCVILGEIFVSLLEHFCLIIRIICQTKRTESLLMCPLSCHSMLRWPNYGGLRRGNYRPRNCHKSDTATNISMPSPTVGTNQKACPSAQQLKPVLLKHNAMGFFCGIDFSSAIFWKRHRLELHPVA